MSEVYLSDRGDELVVELQAYAEEQNIELSDARIHEVRMLANAIDLYEQSAQLVKENGMTQAAPKSGYLQVSPHFTNMNNLHAAVMKHSEKLGFYKIEKKIKKGREDAQGKLIALRKGSS